MNIDGCLDEEGNVKPEYLNEDGSIKKEAKGSDGQPIRGYRRQLDGMGFSFDWSREVRTSDPSFYQWTQWIFLQLFDSWYDSYRGAVLAGRALILVLRRIRRRHRGAR